MEKHPASRQGGCRATCVGVLEAMWDLVRWPLLAVAFLALLTWLWARDRAEQLVRRARTAVASRRGGAS